MAMGSVRTQGWSRTWWTARRWATRRAVLLARPVSMFRSVSDDPRLTARAIQAIRNLHRSRQGLDCVFTRVKLIAPVWLVNVIEFGPLNTYAYSESGRLGHVICTRWTLQTGSFGIPQGTRSILDFGRPVCDCKDDGVGRDKLVGAGLHRLRAAIRWHSQFDRIDRSPWNEIVRSSRLNRLCAIGRRRLACCACAACGPQPIDQAARENRGKNQAQNRLAGPHGNKGAVSQRPPRYWLEGMQRS